MSTREFIRKIKRWARQRDIVFIVKKHESKRSHRRIYLGDRSTTVPWTNDLTTGAVHELIKQLGAFLGMGCPSGTSLL